MLKDILEGRALLNVHVDLDDGWQAEGRCARYEDPDIFYAPIEYESPRYAHMSKAAREKARASDRGRAKEMCRACPVRAQCLQYSMTDPDAREWGMWGGLDKSERTRLRNMLAATGAAA